jgi:hypothetical protein
MLKHLIMATLTASSVGGAVYTQMPVLPLDHQVAVNSQQNFPTSDSLEFRKPLSPECQKAYDHLKTKLDQSESALLKVSNYKAQLEMQERVENELQDVQHVEVDVAHEPMSIHMKWKNNGQEVSYTEGENEGLMTVKPSRGLGFLVRTMNIEPTGSLAMKNCRHPITEAGLLNLTSQVKAFHDQPCRHNDGIQCVESTGVLDGRTVKTFEVIFTTPTPQNDMTRSILMFNEHNVLVGVENYGRCPLGGNQLLERYVYHAPEFQGADGQQVVLN